MSTIEEYDRPSQDKDAAGRSAPPGQAMLHHRIPAWIADPDLTHRDGVFFAAVEMTQMPMVLTDPRQDDCPIVYANAAFLDLTGYEEDEVLHRNCRFLQGVATDPAAIAQLRDAVHQRRPVALEILNYHRDGTPFWNAIFMGPIFDAAGELIYFFASQLDVSKRRESEQSLRQAQKMEAIGQLTAGLAHDFNNLLQIINGSLDRLKARRHDDASFERHHAAAVTAADRGARLTRQLLAFARRTRIEPKDTDLSELVNSFGELLETSVGQHAELFLNLRRRLPAVRVDQSQLEMALLNIVVNARDASPEGGAITVSTAELADGVALSVTDAGAGMPPHVLARATEAFFTTKGVGKGTGLGLAMARTFVEQSCGRLEIDSLPGRGTTVRMVFPRMDAVAQGWDAPAGPVGYRSRPVDQAAPPSILVVDDSPEIATQAERALAGTGYRVSVAHGAEDALQRFEAARDAGDPFHLVFSDVLMPGGADGLTLAQWIRERAPAVPVLLTAGYNDEMSLDGPKAGALEVLGKPYKGSELIDRVQAALQNGVRTGPGRVASHFGPARE